ncbi:hypothetical protein [uncultured Cytophaga sp.]|uniref:hypothetical protein n=1 Tax=uncultured Cytophaga sp. TaxID=160238 RepID=UPI002625798C|nr:hypothetical protein [uncultured Cytophaga sp.]
MVLGVYWYYGFPTDLYTFEFLSYRKGLGGHADAPAELLVNVESDNVDSIVESLRALVAKYDAAFVFIYKLGNSLQIGTGSYNMHDYEFEVARKIEAILKDAQAIKVEQHYLNDAELIRLFHEKDNAAWTLKKHFDRVSSSMKKYNAETACLRFDCNIAASDKEGFLNGLLAVTEAANIHAVFYKEKKCGDRYNLMVFFTNGRQGVGLKPKQKVHLEFLEKGMDTLIEKHAVVIGFIAGFDENYPKGDYIVLKIVDSEFVLD